MTDQTRKDAVRALKALLAGVQANLATTTMILDGTPMTGPEIVQLVDGALGCAVGIVYAHASLTDALKTSARYDQQNAKKLKALRESLLVMYGQKQIELAQYGLVPRKVRTKLTNEQLLARAEKSRATRKARNTMGSRQRKAITGNVTGVTIEPVTSGAATVAGPTTKGPEKSR